MRGNENRQDAHAQGGAMNKDLLMAEHDRLIDEYMDEHPESNWSVAYEQTSARAYDAMAERYAEMADYLRDKMKDERNGQ